MEVTVGTTPMPDNGMSNLVALVKVISSVAVSTLVVDGLNVRPSVQDTPDARVDPVELHCVPLNGTASAKSPGVVASMMLAALMPLTPSNVVPEPALIRVPRI